jgi:hypothetical protein
MKTALALFCIVLGLTVQASKLADMDKSAFGHNLISTVYLQLKTGDSADQVLELLQEVEDQVIQEQQEHDVRHNEFQSACETDKAHYQAEIDDAAADEAENQGYLDTAYPAKAKLEGIIADHEYALAAAEGALEEARFIIAEQRDAFHIHTTELIDALDVFNSARGALASAFQRGSSFLQTSVGASFAQKLKDGKLNARFEPFARILAQAASSNKLTQSAIDQILGLVDRLISNAHSTLSSERQTMQEREDAFAEYEASLLEKITFYQNGLATLRTELQMVVDNIAQWEAALADAQWRFETYTRKLADRTAECDEESRLYSEATAQRTADLAIIDQVEDLISTRVADFTEYISAARDNIEIQ